MPRICYFYGITIYMYFNDHRPAHFHAVYSDFEAVYAIENLEVLRGGLPRRAHVMVIEWALARRAELRNNWQKACRQLPLEQIEPLD